MINESQTNAVQRNAAAYMVKPQLNGPKRQHFLPKFYLEGFSRDGMIAVFDRKLNQLRVQPPVNTCVIGHFYTLEDSAGRKRFELEQLLADYETKASGVIKKLALKETINAEERTNLAIFVAFAAFRTPDIIDSIKALNSDLNKDYIRTLADVEEAKTWIRSQSDAPSSNEELEIEARKLVEFAQSEQYKDMVTTSHPWAAVMAIRMASKIAPILAGRAWVIWHRDKEKKSFVTTDSPVMLTTVAPRQHNFWGVGFGNTDALVLFPLSESCILVMYGNGGEPRHQKISSEKIRQINLALADRCQRFIVGRDEALIRSLADHLRLARKKWQPKMQRE